MGRAGQLDCKASGDGEMAIMADSGVVQYFWRVLDRVEYWLTQSRLWGAAVLCGLSPDCDPRD